MSRIRDEYTRATEKREMRCPHAAKISDCAECMSLLPAPTRPDEPQGDANNKEKHRMKSAEEELNIWKTINACATVQGLIDTLKDIGPVEISGGRGAYDMADRVRQVWEDEGPLNLITRNYGIRQQYVFLTYSGRHQ